MPGPVQNDRGKSPVERRAEDNYQFGAGRLGSGQRESESNIADAPPNTTLDCIPRTRKSEKYEIDNRQ